MARAPFLACLLVLTLTASSALSAPPGTVSPPSSHFVPPPLNSLRPAGDSFVPPSYNFARPSSIPRFVSPPPTAGSPPTVRSPYEIDPVDSWPFQFFRFFARETASRSPTTKEAPARILVKVPADAALWVGGDFTTQTGTVREFNSPPLTVGQKSWYVLRARWIEGEKYLDQTRKVAVTGGETSRVDFTVPEKE